MVKRQCILTLATLLLSGVVCAQALYKFKDANGDWVYTDRQPEDVRAAEVRDLPTGSNPPSVTVTTRVDSRSTVFEAHNEFAVPVEVVVALDELTNLEGPDLDQSMRWVVDANTTLTLLRLNSLDDNVTPAAEYRYLWLPGDPNAIHNDSELYRAPFSVARHFRITQTFPVGITHLTPDSYYAVDLDMPIGTDIYAARGGIVFEVASSNFRGGTDPEKDSDSANIVRVMHDDGSHAVYVHLNWNSIRVRPGDRVDRGEYIAASGNTGFSTGPHLHFVVLINRGMRLVSVPIMFEGSNSDSVEPKTGDNLVAY